MTSREWKFLCLIIAIFIAAGLETDIYLPAFPDMMAYFQTSEAEIQRLLTWNFAGMCMAGPIYGPISDAYGRRWPFVVALALFLMGSLVTLAAGDFQAMLMGRVLQGVGSGGCFTLGTALIFDAFQANKAVVALNHINTIFPFIMAGAPALGGYLNNRYGFRSNFIAVAALVIFSFTLALLFLPETLPPEKRQPLHGRKILRDLKTATTSPPFVLLMLSICLLFSIWMAFLSTVSVLFVLELGVSKQRFPLLQSVPLGAWLVGSLTASTLLRRLGNAAMKRLGMGVCMLGGACFLTGVLIAPRNPYVLVGTISVFSLGLNWFQGLYFPAAMELHPDIKGVTASVLTSARLLIAAVVVGITSHFYNGTIYPVAGGMAVLLTVAMGMVWFYERYWAAPPTPAPTSGACGSSATASVIMH